MKIHRFYVPEDIIGNLVNNKTTEVTPEITDKYFYGDEFIHQLTHVLRFETGDVFHVFNDVEGEYRVSLISAHKKALQIKLESKVEDNDSEIDVCITLAMSLIKKDKFELVTEKATELGVKDIIPMETDRVVQKFISQDRLLRITKEASEQCGRVDIPQVSDTQSLSDILKKVKDYDLCLYGNMEGEMSLKELTALVKKDSVKHTLVFIGPEGGWTEGEVKMFADVGVKSISIHANTLRAETAAIGVLGFLGGIMGL
jgi:16S rRNA (uracil1498-N3)-methyltransferase